MLDSERLVTILYIMGGMAAIALIPLILENFGYLVSLIIELVIKIIRAFLFTNQAQVQKSERFEYNLTNWYINNKETLLENYKLYLRYDKYGRVSDGIWRRRILPQIHQLIKTKEWYKPICYFYIDVARFLLSHIKIDLGDYSIPYGKNLSGRQYEFFCSDVLKRHGWQTTVTREVGDKGVDIIAEKENLKIAIQCKNVSKPVGNSVVNQILGGAKYYDIDLAVIISASGFSNSAHDTAKKLNIILIHHSNIGNLYNLLKRTLIGMGK